MNEGSSKDEGVLFVKANLSIREAIAIADLPTSLFRTMTYCLQVI